MEADNRHIRQTELDARKSLTRKSARIQVAKRANAKSFKSVNLQQFNLIADCHHMAILHLVELEGFAPSLDWISKRLGVERQTIKAALARLVKLKLIDTSVLPWRLNQKFLATPNVPSRAIRHHLHQGLSNAGRALETLPSEDRDFSSLIMSIDKESLPEAKIWLKEFRRNFCQKLDKSQTKNALYNLSIQFYELTRQESK